MEGAKVTKRHSGANMVLVSDSPKIWGFSFLLDVLINNADVTQRRKADSRLQTSIQWIIQRKTWLSD